jgi:TRAP-type C4-dicarboxylate transport system permease small subunit
LKIKTIFVQTFERSIHFLSFLANVFIVVIFFLVIADVLSIFLFGKSISWALEVTEYLLVFITFLGTPLLLKEEKHVRFDLFIGAVKKKLRAWLEMMNSLIGCIACAAISYFSFVTMLNLHARGIKTETLLEIPRAFLIAVVPVAFAMLSIQFFRRFRQWFKTYQQSIINMED